MAFIEKVHYYSIVFIEMLFMETVSVYFMWKKIGSPREPDFLQDETLETQNQTLDVRDARWDGVTKTMDFQHSEWCVVSC
jgi:hypothetical protein